MTISDTVVAYFDGSNLFSTCKALDLKIDFGRLSKYLKEEFKCYKFHYYTALFNTEETQTIIPLIDWLSYNGFIINRKEAKTYTNEDGITKTKGNVDVELTVDMMKHKTWAKIVILFSGDADFSYLINEMQNNGIYVIVVSSIKTNPPMCGDNLRRQANVFIDLADIKDKIGKKD